MKVFLVILVGPLLAWYCFTQGWNLYAVFYGVMTVFGVDWAFIRIKRDGD